MNDKVFRRLNLQAWLYPISICLLACLFTTAAIARPPTANLHFTHLLTDQGKSVGSVETIFQDRFGYMWFGGIDGLVQYDGYNLITYRNIPNDKTSISSNVIWDIFEDKKGDLWIATDTGLNRLNRDQGRFTRYIHDNNNPNSICSNLTRSITEDPQGNLWIATFNGLAKLNPARDSFTTYVTNPNDENSLSGDGVRKVYMDHSGATLWIGQDATGLNSLDLNTGLIKRYPYSAKNSDNLSHSHSHMMSIFQDREGFLWLGTDGGGLNRLNPTTGEFTWFLSQTDNPHSLGHNTVAEITEDRDGNLWIGTENGLNFIDRHTLQFSRYTSNPQQKNTLSSNVIRSVFVDVNHDLWIGNFPTGVSFLDSSNMVFETYRSDATNPKSLSHPSVLSVNEDQNGILWLGTDGGGLNRFDRTTEQFTSYKHDPKNPESISSGGILSIQHDSDGSLWFGTWHSGLNHFDPKTGRSKNYKADSKAGSLSNDNVWSIYKDQQHTIWMGTVGGGINRFNLNTNTFKSYVHGYPNKIDMYVVWKVFQDHKGQIWIGTNEGLGRYIPENDNFMLYRHDQNDPDSLSFNAVLDIIEDNQQQLWIATRGGGLNLFDRKTEKFTSYRENDGLPNDVLTSLVADNLGNVWLGSPSGLTRFTPATGKFTTFTEKNGLQGNQFNISSALMLKSGEMIFGGAAGFTLFDPSKVEENTYIPPVAIVDFQIFNKSIVAGAEGSSLKKSISQTDTITLDYSQSVFSFSFAAMSYRNTEKNKFAYIMEGFEKEWNYVGADRRNATYTNLNPGTYVFKVKAANSSGFWNNEGRSITLHILPPPWRTWWAYTIYCYAIGGMLYGFFYAQQKKVLNERKINKRLQQLDKLKDGFLANTSHELRTPLNGIIGLAESLIDGVGGQQSELSKSNLEMIITSGRRLERLVNAILDFSKLKEHSLNLNLKPIDLYAMTEVVFALSQPSLAGKNTKLVNAIDRNVPPVSADEDRVQQILHNLVGNAIKFSTSGNITVSASVSKNYLEICIQDNGIGISKEELNHIFDSFHQVEDTENRHYSGTGLGLTITKQLVELHGGQIAVQSTPGIGSSFHFTLPLYTDNESLQSPAETPTAFNFAREIITPKPTVATSQKPLTRSVHPTEEIEKTHKAHSQFHILIVDDEPINRQVLMNHLSLQNYHVTPATNGNEALAIVTTQHIDLILLDIMMPSMSGYDVCKQLRERFSSHELPIIFLTAKTQINDLVTGFALGANDFLTKPISRDELLARVNTHLELLEITRNLENKVTERTEELQQKHTQLEDAYLRLEQISLSDPLTGLSNRRYLQKTIPQDIAKVQREYEDRLHNRPPKAPPLDLAFFLLDVDFFKPVNDIYGHAAGDQLLIQLSELLSKVCRETDCLVRWGGEEFLVVSRFSNRDEAPLMAERIRRNIEDNNFILADGTLLKKTCSIGFAHYPFIPNQPSALSWEQVIDTADHALYMAKKSGRNRSVGLGSTDTTLSELLYNRINNNIEELLEKGELVIIAPDTSSARKV